MKSIGARLSLWYALSATVTLACLFVVGYYSLRSYLIHGLDLLNQSEFEQIKAHLGPDYQNLGREVIEKRIRETTDYASVLFYINIDKPPDDVLFYSSNLRGKAIPDVKGKRRYDVNFESAGRLRVAEFILPPFDVTIATPETQVAGVMEGYAEVAVGLLVLMLGVSIAIGTGLSRMALRPVRLIRQTAMHIGSDNLSERIPVPQVKDEISDLALLLNQMFDRIEASFQNVRRFAADASHELKTPLSLMRLHAEKLLTSPSLSMHDEEEIVRVLEEVARLNTTIDELLFLSRAEARSIQVDLSPRDPARLLAGFGADAQVLTEHHGLKFEWHHEGQGVALYEPRWLRRVLLNLLSNAVDVSPPAGRIRLQSRISGNLWRVVLEDQGPGVTEAEREHIFDRFVRLRPVDGVPQYEGSGLGLAICRGVVELHHGRIYAEAAESRGLRIVFEIPAEPPPAPAVSPSAPAPLASA
jgi:two-component system heavy metal sensor histidine kinase CusS